MLKLAVHVAKLLFSVAVAAVVAVLWLCLGAAKSMNIIKDLQKAKPWRLRSEVTCPRGHLIPTHSDVSGAFYRCESCHWTSEGSYWVCGNPMCNSVAEFIDCPTCGLSTRNPYRWGH